MATSLILLWLVQLLMHDMAYVTSEPPVKYVKHAENFFSKEVGETIALLCSAHDGPVGDKVFWYKQKLGMKPIIITTVYRHNQTGDFHGKFRNSRFTLDTYGKVDLHIANVQTDDSGVYHCMSFSGHQIRFLESFTLIVKDSISQLSINQTVFETTPNGSAETLKCIVNTWGCGEKPTVHWLQQSAPGQHNSRRIYNCTVNVCGRVLTGNGTKLSVKGFADGVAVLRGALVFCSLLILGLIFTVYTLKKKNNSLRAEMDRARALKTTSPIEEDQEGDDLHYAAVKINPPSKQRETVSTECVYSTVQLH